MEDAIKNFTSQLLWEPELVNGEKLASVNKYIVCGMGGSPLAASFWRAAEPEVDLLIHRDYGLPRVPDYFLKESLIIICSHSGETEETLSAFTAAGEAGLKVAVITTGGQLLKLAQEAGVPYVQLPAAQIQHRMAVGHFLRALAKLAGRPDLSLELAALASRLAPDSLRSHGEEIAARLVGRLPLIYAPTQFYPLAYAWKVNINETSKVPAFVNVMPELNHNEISGFGLSAPDLPDFRHQFACLWLKPEGLDARLEKRLAITRELYEAQGISSVELSLTGATIWEQIISSFLLSGWVSMALAKQYNLDPESNPVVEEFKKRLA
jgi:glucose/mannose-6-phosphate isomerase